MSEGRFVDGEWLTYRQAAVRLGVSLEAARRRALRGKWRRMPDNRGRTLVMLPDEEGDDEVTRRVGDVRVSESDLVSALKGHNDTLKADVEKLEAKLAEANMRADRAIAALGALADEIAKLAEARSRPWWRRLRIAG
jgi:hypothetical protein